MVVKEISDVRALVFIILMCAATHFALADNYPQKSIRLIVGFPAGGSSDLLARIVSERAGRVLGQQIIVDNRPGAAGTIGMAAAAKSVPDGYTLGYCTIGTCAINSSIYPKLPYSLEKDFAPVILFGSMPNVFVVYPGFPAKSVAEVITLAKAKPGSVSYGSSGFGSSPHLCGELLKDLTGIDLVHVPYKGSPPAIADLRGGQIQLFFENMPSVLPHVRSGAVRALATTGAKRSRALPDIPTMVESGFANFVINPWFGVLAPAQTPSAIVSQLNRAFAEALKDPVLVKQLADLDVEIAGGAPEQLAQHIRAETARWGKLVRERDIRIE